MFKVTKWLGTLTTSFVEMSRKQDEVLTYKNFYAMNREERRFLFLFSLLSFSVLFPIHRGKKNSEKFSPI